MVLDGVGDVGPEVTMGAMHQGVEEEGRGNFKLLQEKNDKCLHIEEVMFFYMLDL